MSGRTFHRGDLVKSAVHVALTGLPALVKMGKFADAIETLRNAPFGSEIDAFPALTYEAIFLYCNLLKRSGRAPPPNLAAALPDDFVTRTRDGKKVGIADLSPPPNGRQERSAPV